MLMDGAQDMELPTNHATGDDDQFVQLMSACKIPEGTQASLIQDGWTVQLFACCASSLEQFDSDLHQLSLPEDSAIAKAALRLLWRQCQASFPSASLTPQAAAQPTATQDTSWLDPFPPKVSAEVLGTLKKDFLSNYPAELLSADVLPGPRMLAWLRRNLQDKQWRFCAWKYRLSVKAHEDSETFGRAPKKARMELQDLLFEELPTRLVGPSLGMHQLSCILHLHTVGIALLKGAHLKVLKDYDRAFLTKAAFRFPPNSGLRGPNPEEMEFADQQLWHEIGDLFEQGWSLDKAIHEVVHVRASLATLLQPRPALPAGVPTPQHPRGPRVRQDDRKGDDRHKGKGRGKSTGKGKGPSGKQAMRQQWATTLDGKSICLRFNGNKGCQEKNCRFLHVCCVQDPATGKACGGKHSATVRKGTPH